MKYEKACVKEHLFRMRLQESRLIENTPSCPKVSIITPSYNQAEFLERTILSVLNQGYSNLEYIIIDGGSSDGSLEIIKKYKRYLSYWVSEKDKGQSDALNKGFAKAIGDIVGWQNSDDIYLPGALKEAVEAFSARPGVDIVFGNAFMVDKDEKLICELKFTPFSLMTHLYEGMALSNQSCFWKRDLFKKIGMFDTSIQFSMDYEFFLRAAVMGARFHHVRRSWGAFRLHEKAKTSLLRHVSTADHANIVNKYGMNKRLEPYIKRLSLLRRTGYYAIQGDLRYIVNGLRKKLFT